MVTVEPSPAIQDQWIHIIPTKLEDAMSSRRNGFHSRARRDRASDCSVKEFPKFGWKLVSALHVSSGGRSGIDSSQ